MSRSVQGKFAENLLAHRRDPISPRGRGDHVTNLANVVRGQALLPADISHRE
jgi:hypothetical protein